MFYFFEIIKYQMVATASETEYYEYSFKSFAVGSKYFVWFSLFVLFYFVI